MGHSDPKYIYTVEDSVSYDKASTRSIVSFEAPEQAFNYSQKIIKSGENDGVTWHYDFEDKKYGAIVIKGYGELHIPEDKRNTKRAATLRICITKILFKPNEQKGEKA